MNGDAFLAYIEQCLARTLKRGDIVVADNVSFKVAGVEEAICAVDASLRYLPQYSPDLNPIELVFHPEDFPPQGGRSGMDATDVAEQKMALRLLCSPVDRLGYREIMLDAVSLAVV